MKFFQTKILKRNPKYSISTNVFRVICWKGSFTNARSLVYSCIQYFCSFACVFFFTKCNIFCACLLFQSPIVFVFQLMYHICGGGSIFSIHFQFNVACSKKLERHVFFSVEKSSSSTLYIDNVHCTTNTAWICDAKFYFPTFPHSWMVPIWWTSEHDIEWK